MSLLDLFRPKYRHSDDNIRREAVEKLKNAAILSRVATTDTQHYVRLAAVENAWLIDETVLADVATNDLDWETRQAAVAKIASEKFLAEIAKAPVRNYTSFGATTDYDRGDAAEKLTDQTLLSEIARTAHTPGARQAAANRLNDQASLATVATTDSESCVRVTAVERLTDQSVLTQVARTDAEPLVRRTAVKILADQRALAEIAKSDADVSVAGVATSGIDDQSVLADLSRTANKTCVRIVAVERLTDVTLLGEVARNAGEWGVSRIATARLSGEAIEKLFDRGYCQGCGTGNAQRMKWRLPSVESLMVAAQLDLAQLRKEHERSYFVCGTSCLETVSLSAAQGFWREVDSKAGTMHGGMLVPLAFRGASRSEMEKAYDVLFKQVVKPVKACLSAVEERLAKGRKNYCWWCCAPGDYGECPVCGRSQRLDFGQGVAVMPDSD